MATKAHTLIFSPTQTGAIIASEIQKGLETDLGETVDISRKVIEKSFSKDDVVIVAMPTYGGRLPQIAVKRFRSINGSSAKAVAIAMYGNAKIDDALLELTNICTEQGFEVIAAGSFIGEHSFSIKKFPLATDRPDQSDKQRAAEFASEVQKLLNSDKEFITPSVPGNIPYKADLVQPPLAATSVNSNCIKCGLCETFCPTGAIELTKQGVRIAGEKCIFCCACVKVCTSHAMELTLPKLLETAERLFNNFKERKEPEWYLAKIKGE